MFTYIYSFFKVCTLVCFIAHLPSSIRELGILLIINLIHLINLANLKQGTLTQAKNYCGRSQIMTPDICHNTTVTDTIIDVVRDARLRFNMDSTIAQMWIGIRRHNATHFSNGNKWFIGTELGSANLL